MAPKRKGPPLSSPPRKKSPASRRKATASWYPTTQPNGRTSVQNPTIAAVAAAHGKSPAQVLIRWSLQLGNVVIPRSSDPARIAENIDVFDFELTADELETINGLDDGTRFRPNPDTYTGA